MDNRPIGVFDSGLGGLTAVKELITLLPNEDIVYFGDTGRVPYGTKSRQTICKYARQDIALLKQYGVKMILAACGTVSSIFPAEDVKKLSVLFSGVLLPAVQQACAASKTKTIGVLGTPATIHSGAYAEAIRTICPHANIIGVPCPLFVPLVENGYVDKDNRITRLVAAEYLSAFDNLPVDTVILGCTHFPLLKDIIADIVGQKITLIDPGKEAAGHAAAQLAANDMLTDSLQKGSIRFLVSDDIESFQNNAQKFLGRKLEGEIKQVAAEC